MFNKSSSHQQSLTTNQNRVRYTKRFIKYGGVALVIGVGYHLIHENFFVPETSKPTQPNTIIYVKTSEIAHSERHFSKLNKWQSFMNKYKAGGAGGVKYGKNDKYLEPVMPQYCFLDYLLSLEKAIRDENVVGLVVDNDVMNLGTAQTQELREVLKQFSEVNRKDGASRKLSIVYADHFMDRNGYWLASAFPRVFLHPTGMVQIPNNTSRLFYLRDLLNRMGLDMNKFVREQHKHAANILTFSGTEDEFNRETQLQNEARDKRSLNTDIFDQMLNDIAASRRKQLAVGNQTDAKNVYTTVSELLKQAIPAKEANKLGLVDALDYRDSLFRNVITEYLRNDSSATFVKGVKEPGRYTIVSLEEYTHNRVLEQKELLERFKLKSQDEIKKTDRVHIGVITYQGNIARETTTNLLWQLNQARDRKDLDAVVVRITSPGGDSIASDTIRHYLEMVQKSGKRVIVSMGNVAASGGYEFALPADRIVASPSTITGSIGVVGLRPKILSEVLDDKGIRSRKVSGEGYENTSDFFEPMTREEIDQNNKIVDALYDDFVTKVAVARKMTKEQALQVAQGKVYTGRQAAEVGLVDELGGFRDAIDLARVGDITDRTGFKRPFVLHPINEPPKSTYSEFSKYFQSWSNLFNFFTGNATSYESKSDIKDL